MKGWLAATRMTSATSIRAWPSLRGSGMSWRQTARQPPEMRRRCAQLVKLTPEVLTAFLMRLPP